MVLIISRRLFALSVPLLLAAAAALDARAGDEAPWTILAPGLELGRFDADGPAVDVLRIDPRQWETVALAASATDGLRRTPRQWARDFDLTAVINAGMYAQDGLTHVGFLRTGQHVNNSKWIRRDYRQVACFEPREPGLPLFALVDLDAAPDTAFADDYEIVVQNIRLVRKHRQNRWLPGTRRWTEACLGEDEQGRMLWIYCRQPLEMHALNERLLTLPLGLVAAQHLEGGPEAQIWVRTEALDPAARSRFEEVKSHINNSLSFPLPNVLGIRPRSH